MALVGIVGIIVAVCTLKAIQVQAGLMEEQLREMQEAGKQAARQLSLTERPWISVNLKLIGPLDADETEMRLPLLVEATNVGKSPALGVTIELAAYVLNPTRPSMVIEQRRIADQAKAVSAANPVFGDMLFPGSPPLLQVINIPITVAEIDKYTVGGGELYYFIVILGVAYRSTIDEAAKHCTCVVYDVNRIDLQYPGSRFGFRKGEGLSPASVQISPNPFMAPIAE